MDAIKSKKITVVCDACNYRVDIKEGEAKEYHNRPCPECGQALLDDQDIKILAGVLALKTLINTVVGDIKEGKLQETVSLCSRAFKNKGE